MTARGHKASALADAIRVLHALRPETAEARAQMLRLLGVQGRGAVVPQAAQPTPARQAPTPTDTPRPKPPRRPSSKAPTKEATPAPPSRKALPATLETTSAPPTVAPPDWLYDIAAPAAPARVTPAYRKPIAPLLDPRRARSVLVAVLSRPTPAGPIDTRRLVSMVARRRPITTVPRHSRAKVSARVQLLLDQSPAMAPFALDAQALALQVPSVIGLGGVSVQYFGEHPIDGVLSADTGLPVPYRPPDAGVPVLVATVLADKAVPQRRQIAAWREMQHRLGQRAATLSLLVIGSDAAIAAAVKAGLTALPWDRSLTLQSLKQARALT
ncbi:MAG: hypothetical protein AAFQ19_00850 [Pseudomonadota bacterium]